MRELDKSISVGTLCTMAALLSRGAMTLSSLALLSCACVCAVRTDSITTKFVREFLLMSTWTFLHASLAPTVRRIIAEPAGYECDPAKLSGEVKVGERLKRLALAADEVLRAVSGNLGALPRDVRRFFANVAAGVELYFAGNYRTVAAGFLFLRFLCPAIFSPVMFGLVAEKVEDEAQRALILVAKVLQVGCASFRRPISSIDKKQNLANGVKFGQKEAFLAPLNAWLDAKLPIVAALFERLSDADADAASAAPFDARAEAGDFVPQLAAVIRRTTPRLPALLKTTESNASALNSLGGLLRFKELTK